MPVDIGASTRKVCGTAFGSNFLRYVLLSPVYTSIIISVMLVIIVIVIYPAQRGASGYSLFKVFLYSTITSLLIIYMHNSILKHNLEDKYANGIFSDVMNNVSHGSQSGAPITHNIGRFDESHIPESSDSPELAVTGADEPNPQQPPPNTIFASVPQPQQNVAPYPSTQITPMAPKYNPNLMPKFVPDGLNE